MTALESLKNLKEFLTEEVANKIKLLKEDTSDEYVNPYVALITLPHKNFMPVTFQVPHILVGFETGNENDSEHAVNIRIVCATYGGDTEFGAQNHPNENGYIDLLNLMERTKMELVQNPVIARAGLVEKDFTYGIYQEEITYPYWYGYIQFKMQLPIDNRQMIEHYL